MNVDYHIWQKKRAIQAALAVCLVLLVLVYTQDPINNARRWLRYGALSFQPSEITKLVLLAFMAWFLAERESDINRPRTLLFPCLAVIGVYAGLIAAEPDLGQALCIGLFAGILLFAAGLSWKYIGGAAIAAIPIFYFGIYLVPFRWERLKAWIDPWSDKLGAGWHIVQSIIAVGSGGIFGLGLGESRQKRFFLPEAHSDFIYAVIGEELGLIGTLLVLSAFLFYFHRGLRIALRAPDRFGFFLALGVTLMVVLQAWINISMVLAMMPTKGIALPFISQGGSSLLLNLAATGVLLNISHYTERS